MRILQYKRPSLCSTDYRLYVLNDEDRTDEWCSWHWLIICRGQEKKNIKLKSFINRLLTILSRFDCGEKIIENPGMRSEKCALSLRVDYKRCTFAP